MLGMDDEECALAFQQMGALVPIHAGTVHRDVGTACWLEPVRQRQQGGGHGAEGADFLHGLEPLRPRDEACHTGLCVDVEATAMGIDHVHPAPPYVMTRHGVLG